MSTAQEIEDAIRSLPPAERAKLVADLPSLLPEIDGDAAWERIIRDPRPSPALSAFLDQAEEELKRNPGACFETSEEEFDRRK